MHPVDIHPLAFHVNCAHVDHGLDSEVRPCHRNRGSMLSCACFCDDSGLAHVLCEQSLPYRVVQLVCAAVHEVLPLDVDLDAVLLAQAFCVVERRWSPCEIRKVTVKLIYEFRIVLISLVSRGQFFYCRHQGLGDELPAVDSEFGFGGGFWGHGLLCFWVLVILFVWW